jgi:hypothetical protein
VTFVRPEDASSRWVRLPPPDEAATTAIVAYLRAYAPASVDNFHNWLAGGRVSTRQVRTWFAAVGDRMREVEVDGERRYVLAGDLDELVSTKPTKAVRLLPGFDQYVLGPGTEDAHVVPAARRRAVSQQSGWIAPIVVAGGVVRGTWELAADAVQVKWFKEAGAVPRAALQGEAERLSAILGRDLRVVLS